MNATTLDIVTEIFSLHHDIARKKDIIEIPNTDREILARLFKELGFTIGAEIGVERALYAETLLKENPNLNLFAIDAWTAYKGYRDHVTQGACDGLFAEAQERLKPFGERVDIIKGFSEEVFDEFEDNSLDFVYIDANHEYQHVVNDIANWSRKVKVGGIVAGHDYVKRTNKQRNYLMHVPMALRGWMESYEISPLFVLGRKDVIEGERRDKPRSWFYVKTTPPPIAPHLDKLA